ncbi:MAG: hypothetical protein ACTH2E_00340, partial [Microbacterium sp.]
ASAMTSTTMRAAVSTIRFQIEESGMCADEIGVVNEEFTAGLLSVNRPRQILAPGTPPVNSTRDTVER